MTQLKKGDKVKVHYTAKLDDGTVIDTSKGKEPLVFTVGSGETLPKFEEQVTAMSPGEKKSFKLSFTDAYGPRNEQLSGEIPRNMLPSDLVPEADALIQIQQPNGQVVMVKIVEVKKDTIVVDANHPLAGKNLSFDVEFIGVVK